MKNHKKEYERLIEKIIKWAKDRDDISTVIIVGSRARTNTTADKWSDLDLVILVSDPDYYINNTDWINYIDNYWITFIEETAVGGGEERRVLFEGGLDVDFAIFSVDIIDEFSTSSEIQSVLKRGHKVLLDKDDLFGNMVGNLTVGTDNSVSEITSSLPSSKEFNNLVNDFWYHSVWSTKKILRGELWTAITCIDGYMKDKLLNLIEWQAQVKNGKDYDTWHGGRLLEEWTEEKVLNDLKDCFAHYEKEDMKQALLKTMNLFRRVAEEVADFLDYEYPVIADEKATSWVKDNLR